MSEQTEFSGITADGLYTQTELAPILRKSAGWFERARWAGEGPSYIKIGRSVVYRGSAVIAWLESRSTASTSDRGAA
ncbi:MAG: helix-turn-helix transcriptional regulator [Acidiferrobacteraceae bacterium]